jgi:AmmeMemoRadiSam system protein B
VSREARFPTFRSNLRVGRRVTDDYGRPCVVVQDPILRGLTHPGFRLSEQSGRLISLMDGTRSVSELAEAMHSSGSTLGSEEISSFVSKLTELKLLDTLEVNRLIAALECQFAKAPVRPMSNGVGSPVSRSAVETCFDLASLQSDINHDAEIERPHLLLMPHAAIEISGLCSARAATLLAHHSPPTLYVIVGPNHVTAGQACAEIVLKPFETPFGKVEVSSSISRALLDSGLVELGYLSHFREHSIENVLIFLQCLHDRHRDPTPFQIIPLLVRGVRHRPGVPEPHDHTALWQSLGRLLRDLHEEHPSSLVLIASGDFSHIGQYYGLIPPGVDSASNIQRWEQPIRDAIVAGDATTFLEHWIPTNACAGRPILTMLSAAAGWRWQLIDHAVTEEKRNFLSIAAYAAWPASIEASVRG